MSKGNESAFPTQNMEGPVSIDTSGVAHFTWSGGLTKREYFAAMFLQAMISGGGEKFKKVDAAIEYADLLLAELEESKS